MLLCIYVYIHILCVVRWSLWVVLHAFRSCKKACVRCLGAGRCRHTHTYTYTHTHTHMTHTYDTQNSCTDRIHFIQHNTIHHTLYNTIHVHNTSQGTVLNTPLIQIHTNTYTYTYIHSHTYTCTYACNTGSCVRH